jgi:hypothetical protein
MSVLNNQTFRHPSDAFSNTNHALLAVAVERGTCQLSRVPLLEHGSVTKPHLNGNVRRRMFVAIFD